MSVIRVEGLTFGYGEGPAVFECLSLEIEAGSATVILGPNGAGKSTLLSLLLGYNTPREGRIEILGTPLSSYQRHELGQLIAYVSDETYLPFNYSVLDYVLLGRAARVSTWSLPAAPDYRALDDAIERVGIGALRNRSVQELSAGELQLVSVARALAQQPRLLLMDEPTSHLDPANARAVFRLMRELTAAGLTVLFTTHDPVHARQVADRAVLLGRAGLVAAGAAATALSAENLGTLYGVRFEEARSGERRIPFVDL
jgi:iron complex transport system ATP-binding protein